MHTSALAHLPKNGPPELLYLLFHGVGSNADSMLPLAQRLIREYPQAAVLCLNAPDRFDAVIEAVTGDKASDRDERQWFSIRRVDEANRPGRVATALPAFIATVRALQQRFGVAWERTALAGFSQGAVMALEAVQHEPMLAGRVLAFAGRHAAAPTHAPLDTTVHLFHGLADTVIPAAAAIDSAQTLVALGADVTADVLPGIAHELHPLLLDKATLQLRTFLPQKVWREAMREAPALPRESAGDERAD
jgi:phospholipase/carboxylesterase